jgi:multidrug efflux pump subunit AcrA (membrane-fusion protein)
MKNLLRNKTVLSGGGVLTLALVLLLSGAFSNPYRTLEFVEAVEGEFILDVVVRGELLSERSRFIVAPSVRGRTQLVWLIEEGVYVEAGETVARLDVSDLQNRVEQREEELELVQGNLDNFLANRPSQLSSAEASVKTAEYDFELAEIRLQLSEFESVQQQEQRKLAYENALLSLDDAQREQATTQSKLDLEERELRTRIRQAEQRLNDTLRQLDQSNLKAPIAGLVVFGETFGGPTEGERKIRVGDSVHRGQTIITIPDLSEILVKMNINEVDFRKVTTGLPVELRVDAIQGSVFPGHMEEMAILANYDSQERESYFTARAHLDSLDAGMRPGMTATVRIITGREENALYIPNRAVFQVEGNTVVFPRKELPRPRIVLLGDRNLDFVRVEEGLVAGEEIALTDPRAEDDKEAAGPNIGGGNGITGAGNTGRNGGR